ncbi:sensor histidine kinase [Georgenia alba]|uniref:Oxygen sensor histidine kinase NreB n=1 Tax=Georgenia alba TaxID=2233858 RepID=A0ABW2QHH1_9MICO
MRGWYSLVWVVFGLCPGLVAVLRNTGDPRYISLVILGAMGVAYALVTLLPDLRAIRLSYLALLVPALGAMAFLPGGGAALLLLTLPQFWLFTSVSWQAIGFAAAATAAVVAGSLAPTDDAIPENAVAAAAAFALSLPIIRWWHRNEHHARERDHELARTQQALADAHRREGAVQERDRIAREIHDTLAQGFASIVALAEAGRLTDDPDQRDRHLISIEVTARENLAEARILVGSEPPPTPSSLRRMLVRFADDTGIEVHADSTDDDLSPRIRAALLRCAQESLANIRKHASASTVTVELVQHHGAVQLEIADDGRGFNVAEARGFGIDGMRRRIAELGGELTLTSSIGDGTRILIDVPIPAEERS